MSASNWSSRLSATGLKLLRQTCVHKLVRPTRVLPDLPFFIYFLEIFGSNSLDKECTYLRQLCLTYLSQHWPLLSAFDPTAYCMRKTQEQPVVSLDIFSSRKTPRRTVASAMGKLVSLIWHTLIMFPNSIKLKQNTKRFNSF